MEASSQDAAQANARAENLSNELKEAQQVVDELKRRLTSKDNELTSRNKEQEKQRAEAKQLKDTIAAAEANVREECRSLVLGLLRCAVVGCVSRPRQLHSKRTI